MVIVEKNFLTDTEFQWLNSVAKQKATFSLELVEKKKPSFAYTHYYTSNKSAWHYSLIAKDNGMPIIYGDFGVNIKDIIDKTTTRIKDVDPELGALYGAHFMFAKNGYEVPTHLDKRKNKTTMEQLRNVYKAFIFCHEVWDDKCGGELCFSNQNIVPYPNTLVVYSNDELHWVNLYTNTEYYRMIFGMRWGDE